MGTVIYIIWTITAIVITFFALLIGAIIFYKRRNKKVETKQEIKPELKKEIPKEKTLGMRKYSRHNNRKTGRGRKVQYIELNGRTKPIYH